MTTPSSLARPLALSAGDPAGVGGEIIAKAWRALREDGPPFVVIGDAQLLASAGGGVKVRKVTRAREALDVFADALPVIDIPLLSPVVAGQPSPAYAPQVIRWIETGVGLALSGEVAGLVTAPIAKVPAALTIEGIVNTGLVTADALRRDFGIAAPRLAIAGLNPHAGEGGAIGREELEIIGPAVEQLRAAGVDAQGPSPADTLFHAEARARYDGVLCMYHDQALIPVKMLDFWGGVNITLGLPIVRTSPDHGTGFDIAGRGIARPDSLIAAIRLAAEIAARRGG